MDLYVVRIKKDGHKNARKKKLPLSNVRQFSVAQLVILLQQKLNYITFALEHSDAPLQTIDLVLRHCLCAISL